MSSISTAETARILGVSGATVRNWARAGHLSVITSRPISFNLEEVLALKERIRTNRFNKLRKRANKSASDTITNPEIRDAKIAADLAACIQELDDNAVSAPYAVFAAAMHYLNKFGEVSFRNEPKRFEDLAWRRPAVETVMRRWYDRAGSDIYTPKAGAVEAFLGWKDCDDPLGLLYQGLSSVGTKSRTGAYFTPGDIIDATLADLGGSVASFLDPCCGTGRFLVRAARRFDLPFDQLYGFDTDPVAVDIASLNLLLAYPDVDQLPRIRCLDSLRDLANGEEDCDTNTLLGAIDAVATNPPWGGCKNQDRHRNLVAHIKSGESFSLFLEKALRLLRPGGRLSFILPESMLKIKARADIRKLVLDQACIERIALLGRVFAGVFTPIIRLDLSKRPAPDDWKVTVFWDGKEYQALQKRFAVNVNHAFDVAVTPRDAEIMAKITTVPHQTLAGNADWALGIVTGDNSRCVLDAPCEGSEPILRGRDVFKYAPRAPRCHIVFKPQEFQQVAPERYYRAPEKLIYRFVSDHLVFAYDNQSLLTLNSANILIPRLPGYSIKYVLAFLNSRVFQYLFIKRFQTRKILRGDLETMPFPHTSPDVAAAIEHQVDLCMSGEYQPADELDQMIYRIFHLEDDEVVEIEKGLAPPPGRVLL